MHHHVALVAFIFNSLGGTSWVLEMHELGSGNSDEVVPINVDPELNEEEIVM